MWWVVFALHILMAALWVGGMFFALAVLRPSLGVLAPADRLTFHAQIFRRFALVIWHAMPITLASGYALLFGVYGGFRGTPWNIHLMHLTGLIMGVVYLALFFGPYRTFRARPSADAVRGIRNLMAINLVLGLLTIALAGAHRYGL
jgi:uncharacterized membrane protein